MSVEPEIRGLAKRPVSFSRCKASCRSVCWTVLVGECSSSDEAGESGRAGTSSRGYDPVHLRRQGFAGLVSDVSDDLEESTNRSLGF